MKFNRMLLATMLLAFAHVLSGRADSPRKTPPAAIEKTGKGDVKTFEGKAFGTTDEQAQENALANALAKARVFLTHTPYHLGLSQPWTLTAAERQKLVKWTQHPDQDVDEGSVKCWSATVEIPPAQVAVWQRQERSQERMGLMARVVALLVLGAAAVAGYLRLEEWAHWRHTLLPRLAGAGVLAAAAAGAWCWF